MDKKNTKNRKRRRGAEADAENKIQEPKPNKILKPIIEASEMYSPSMSPCMNTIKLEEVEYTEIVGLETLPKSENYFEDPSNWTDLSEEDIKQIVIKGPPIHIRGYSFPKTNNRKFSTATYRRTLANGKIVSRPWLVYSKSQDSVFCFCCFLFATNKISHALSSTGCSGWSHLSSILKSHETSLFHLENFKSWKLLEKRLSLNQTIDAQFENSIRNETKHWIAVGQRIFVLVRFLGSQALTFRGASDDLYDVNNGNFLQLVEEVASFDSVLGEHLRRITNQETLNIYLSRNIQNEIISIISRSITSKIVSMVKESRYFSIIVDSTPDKTFKEQISIVVRFVYNNYKTFEVEEHFLGFLNEDAIDEGLTKSILDKLECLGISLNNCRGQSYESSSNMKAKKAGTQNIISTLEPRAFLVPCCSNSLCSVVNDLARCSFEAVKFFDVVNCLYNFVSSSTMRWKIYIQNVPNLSLNPLSVSRWESNLDALKPLKTNLGDIYEALVEISAKGNPEERNTAESLGKKINTTSKYLQSACDNLSATIQTLQNIKLTLVEMRSDIKFNDYIQSAEREALNLEISTEFPETSCLRSRRIKKENNIDEFSKTYRFKEEFYFKILDQAIETITERFKQLETFNSNFSFLYNISECTKLKSLRLSCLTLQKALTTEKFEDLNGPDLFQELVVISPLIRKDTSSLEVLNFIFCSGLEDLAPNVVIALQILNTLPVIKAPSELGVSKSKLIQNYLRFTSSQEKLEDLSIMAIENELVKSLDYDDLITDFAKAMARKVCSLE